MRDTTTVSIFSLDTQESLNNIRCSTSATNGETYVAIFLLYLDQGPVIRYVATALVELAEFCLLRGYFLKRIEPSPDTSTSTGDISTVIVYGNWGHILYDLLIDSSLKPLAHKLLIINQDLNLAKRLISGREVNQEDTEDPEAGPRTKMSLDADALSELRPSNVLLDLVIDIKKDETVETSACKLFESLVINMKELYYLILFSGVKLALTCYAKSKIIKEFSIYNRSSDLIKDSIALLNSLHSVYTYNFSDFDPRTLKAFLDAFKQFITAISKAIDNEVGKRPELKQKLDIKD